MNDERDRPRRRPVVRLIGQDGNSFAILGACRRARAAAWTDDDWASFHVDATSGNYDHLLATVMEHFDVE